MEDNSNEGRTLSIRFQLWDQDDRSQISKDSLQIYTVLKSLADGAEQDIGDCTLEDLSEDTGIGDCEILLSSSLFPRTGEKSQNVEIFIEAR